ncbi:type II toxin-antitoxin system mRNA interferase toxin, RelE/StbE family [Massilia sp. FT127W]|uniref:Type II toxin-antitoxin system mRNA interferase toxin, RelE/StbE family n=2 Tax=Pseudoduganella aquatica TaxID=2660641 RepID=A0A7X4H943_9BURK|nr:type II toxin-antitoxin system mRNA interferase toxin, RelE/StbE family [Pseudoduganella aquatica]
MALADRERIMDFIARDNPAAALKLDELIEKKTDQLTTQPTLYRIGRKAGTREMVVHPNYLVIYRIHKGCIEILRVKHAAKKRP